MTLSTRALVIGVLVQLLVAAPQAVAQSAGSAGGDVLATVRIDHAVLANGDPLPMGTYDVRLTGERPRALPGQSPDAQRWVEFVSDGKVVAREVAEIIRDDDRPATGASSDSPAPGTRVDMLMSGEFLRISVARGDEQFLIYLPVAG